MKKNIYILTLFLLVAGIVQAQTACCPKFVLKAGMLPCPDTPKLGGPIYGHEQDCKLSACKNTKQSYTIVPYVNGFTYEWQISGGLASNTSNNPIQITWGNGTSGTIKVFITSVDGKCKDTITQTVCLKNSPTASFSFAPVSPVCLNQPVQFTNTSIGAVTHYWNFGDGNTSTQANPNHVFTTPGTYIVTLAVNNAPVSSGGSGGQSGGPIDVVKDACGCTDTLRKTIVVKAESVATIIPGCQQMLCKGDTASYCTTSACSSYNWSVTGGRIIGSSTGNCINVVWDGVNPATVTLNGNCGGTCGNSGTLNVPVLYPTMPVQGNAIVCPSSFANYSLPTMPGTFYTWSISGGGTIVGASVNTSSIIVQWGNTPGTYTIDCNYNNPVTGCSGKTSITVNVLPPYKITGPTQFCVGTPFNFSTNGNGNWSIQPSTGFSPSSFSAGSSITGIWNTAGNYIVTATPTAPANYCSYPASINVAVIDTPKLNAITGDLVVCPGSTYMYKITSNINDGLYTWTISGGTILSYLGTHQDSVMINWNTNGPYTVSVKQTVMGCSSSIKTISINQYPTPIITSGPSSSCMDNTTTYIATGSAPANGFTWTLSNALGTIVNGQGTNTITVLWHGTTSSNNTCIVKVQTCGGADNRVVTVVPTPPVTIAKAGTLCSSTGISLTASVSNGTNYVWQHNGITLAPPANTAAISVQLAGTYKVTITNANGCISTATIIVPKESLSLTASISTTDKVIWYCTENINALLHAAPSSTGYCYQWYSKQEGAPGLGNPISGATTPNFTATGIGLFWCEVRLCNTSCVALTDTIKVSKYGCTDGGTCDPNYTATITNTNCNPMSFTGAAVPAAATGGVHWYFGDGDEGYGTSITHQYKDTGSYKVCAVFGTSPYCRKDICKIIRVTVAANFSAAVACDKVTITNLSKAALPITYNWSFPGGSPASSNAANPPPITYANGGLQTASVTISDGLCTVTYSDTFTTYAISPTITVPSPICALTLASFSVGGTHANDTYQWNFGDGFISNMQNPTHAYASAGNYTVTVIVTNSNECSKIVTQNIVVQPPLNVSIGTDKFICPGSIATLTTSPATFTTYQWYKNGVAIPNATAATYGTTSIGEYWVQVSNGNGCSAVSNHINVLYHTLPIADILGKKMQCTANLPFNIQNSFNQSGVTYAWTSTGPSTVTFAPANAYSAYASIVGSVPGEYQFILTAINTTTQCVAKDTVCISIAQSPTVSVSGPSGNLCEGGLYTFTASAVPILNFGNYSYQWSSGNTGNVLTTGNPGPYQVTVQNPSGCTATAFAGTIKKRPDISLFPVGCDTLCWTDTLRFPLPQISTAYTVTWYDNDGTAIANVGSGVVLPLSSLQPGIHHLYATVSVAGGCADTTGTFDLYIKDCTLPPACDNCTGLLESASVETNINLLNGANSQISNTTITFTILKPIKEVRISLSDLVYYWKDTTCNNCKIQLIERGCLFAAATNQPLGTLLPDSATGVNQLQNATINNCSGELIWKNGTPLPPGTYTIPLQLSLPKPAKKSCVLVIEKLCFHITLIDEDCKVCDTRVCVKKEKEDCRCGLDNSWTSLYLVPKKTGIAKPHNQILCNSVLNDMLTNTAYTISGLYHCYGNKCLSTQNEISVYNQLNEIIYTRISGTLNETLVFPTPGMYRVSLTANCGTKKCICSFRIYVTDGKCTDCTPIVTVSDTTYNPNTFTIDSVVKQILPPDFNGGLLVAKDDSTLYEKYIGFKHKVDKHTAFDLASITKTFTAMAVLKLMEDSKLILDDVVANYIPRFPYPDITIKMLLSHRSGLEDYLKFMDESDWDKRKTVSNNDILAYIINNKTKVQIALPNKTFDYSNTNFVLLSFIIEKVSGQSYKDYLTTTFFKPLQMNDTYLLSIENYESATKSFYKTGKVYTLRYLDLVYGDKNIFSTVQDLKKWDKALRSGKLFKKSTLDLAYFPNTKSKDFVSTYALGWKKIVTSNKKEILYHNGWWAGNRCVLIRLLKEKVVIAVVSNNNFSNIADIRKLCDLFGDYQQTDNKITGF